MANTKTHHKIIQVYICRLHWDCVQRISEHNLHYGKHILQHYKPLTDHSIKTSSCSILLHSAQQLSNIC